MFETQGYCSECGSRYSDRTATAIAIRNIEIEVVEAIKKYRGMGLDHRDRCSIRDEGIPSICSCGMAQVAAALDRLAALRAKEGA